MNGLETFLTAAGGLIAALGGFEFVKYLMNKNSNDRIMAAKAFQEERKTILEDYARIQKEVDRMQALIDELRKRVKNLEETRLDLIKENNELKLQLKEAEHNICLRPDDECFKGRIPVRDYCRLKRVANGYYDMYYDTKELEEEEKSYNKKDNVIAEKKTEDCPVLKTLNQECDSDTCTDNCKP